MLISSSTTQAELHRALHMALCGLESNKPVMNTHTTPPALPPLLLIISTVSSAALELRPPPWHLHLSHSLQHSTRGAS